MNDYWKKYFGWSSSRQNTWSTCKLRYYFAYIGKWEGFRGNRDRDKLQWLSRLKPWYMVKGSLVHEAIERSRRGRCPCPVCSGHDIEEVYRESSFDTAYRLLRSHHIFSELAGEKRQTEHIRAGNLDTYLCKKEIPVRSGLVGRIVRQIGAVRIT